MANNHKLITTFAAGMLLAGVSVADTACGSRAASGDGVDNGGSAPVVRDPQNPAWNTGGGVTPDGQLTLIVRDPENPAWNGGLALVLLAGASASGGSAGLR